MGDMVAAMRIGEKGLGPIAGPFDRTPDLLRRPDHHRLFGIDENLRAETAADVGAMTLSLCSGAIAMKAERTRRATCGFWLVV